MKRTTRTVAAVIEALARPWDGPAASRLAGLSVLGYHRIDDSSGHLSVSLNDFRAHLDWVEATGLRVVDVGDGGQTVPSDSPAVAFTFDDGYLSVAEAAWPELKGRGWPMTFYVVPGYLRGAGHFPWDEGTDERARLVGAQLVRELSDDGVTIGSHTMSHRYLPGLGPREAESEIRDSRRALQDLLGRDVTSFSYPMGGYNDGLRGSVAQAGYSTAVTTRRGRNRAGRDLLALRRPIVESDPGDFVRIMKGHFDFLRPADALRERIRQARAREGRPAEGLASD